MNLLPLSKDPEADHVSKAMCQIVLVECHVIDIKLVFFRISRLALPCFSGPTCNPGHLFLIGLSY